MALSGSASTNSYDGRYYKVSWTATQDVAKNTSTISYTVEALGGESSWYAERTLEVIVAGTTVVNKTDRVERREDEIKKGTVTVTHDTEGNKSFSISIRAAVYYPTVNCTANKSFTLNTIPRKSTMKVDHGTLGTAQTLTVTRQSSSFTHTITVQCGDDKRTICTKSSTTSISFTPPLDWAKQQTAETKVGATFTITTYSGNTSVGSNMYVRTYTMPASVKPSCKITVTDAAGYADTYGYLKGLSKFKIVVTPTTSYGSAISSYKITANGSTYTTSTATTNVIASSGELTISASVTDKRGRTGTAEVKVKVTNYEPPKIEYLKVKRVNAEGEDDDQGEYVNVQCSTVFTYLSGKNTQQHKLSYCKTSETALTNQILSLNVEDSPEGDKFVRHSWYTFPADTGSSYKLTLYASDKFKTATKNTLASTAFTIMHWLASGLGIAFGKVAEMSGILDTDWIIQPRKGFKYPYLERGTDLNDVTDFNTYYGDAVSTYGYLNCPITSATSFSLEVLPAGSSGQIIQRFITCSATPVMFHRTYYGGKWYNWVNT